MKERSVKPGPLRSTQTTLRENRRAQFDELWSISCMLIPRICSYESFGLSTDHWAFRSIGSTWLFFMMRSPNLRSITSLRRLPPFGSNSYRMDIWQHHGSSLEARRHSMGHRVHVPASRGTVIYSNWRSTIVRRIKTAHTPDIASTTLDLPSSASYWVHQYSLHGKALTSTLVADDNNTRKFYIRLSTGSGISDLLPTLYGRVPYTVKLVHDSQHVLTAASVVVHSEKKKEGRVKAKEKFGGRDPRRTRSLVVVVNEKERKRAPLWECENVCLPR